MEKDMKQDDKQEENNQPTISCKKKLISSLDLFQFMPVPKTEMISSRRSLYGSILMIVGFVGYFIFTLVTFITNNSPTVNQFEQIMESQNITLPDLAFAFFFGDPFTKTINDPTIFSFSFQQVTKYQDVSKSDIKLNIALVSCNPEWLPTSNFTLLCPNQTSYMAGALYQTPEFVYPRISVTYCTSGSNFSCIDENDLFEITAGGRIILYIKDESPNFDLTTGAPIESIPYTTYQYFLMPGLYPRSEIYFQQETYTILPDFLRRWQSEEKQYLTIEKVNTWVTNVSIYSFSNAYQIAFRAELTEQVSTLTYKTLFDMISLWGAFWGVLFSAFAAYFLVYNRETFYQNNKQWEDFGKQIGVKKAVDTFNLQEEAPHSKVNDSIVFDISQEHNDQTQTNVHNVNNNNFYEHNGNQEL